MYNAKQGKGINPKPQTKVAKMNNQGSASNICKSLFFSLVKHNAGAFKSEKQAAFLLRFFDDGVFISSSEFTFGEYDAKTKKNTRQIDWVFCADKSGIQKVEKINNNDIRSIYWENTQEYIKAQKEQEDKRRQSVISDLKGAIAFNRENINNEFDSLDMVTAAAKVLKDNGQDVTAIEWASESIKSRLNGLLNDYQQWAIRAKLTNYTLKELGLSA